jgi:rare lipoprotein A
VHALNTVARAVRIVGVALALVLPITLPACRSSIGPEPVRPRTAMPQTPGVERGMATFYGDEQGTQTASGERFDKHKLTAAHRTLPLGTRVRVTNTKNGRSVEVRINDRGPFGGHGRIIDVSEAAARQLDMIAAGVVPVTLEVLH